MGTIAAMSTGDGFVTFVPVRRLLAGALAGLVVALAGAGCRANAGQCREVADHLTEIASDEGRAAPGMADALAADCEALEPSAKLVECMLAAETLEAARAC